VVKLKAKKKNACKKLNHVSKGARGGGRQGTLFEKMAKLLNQKPTVTVYEEKKGDDGIKGEK